MLLAVGRRARLSGLELERARVEYGLNGIETDRNLRTSQRHIYAAGDCLGGFQFTHYAGWQGFMAVRNALIPGSTRAVLDRVPWATFTDPEISSVGISEDEAKEKGIAVKIGKFPFAALGKAMAMCETDGFVKVIADAETTQILGVHIVGPEASAMISEAALSLEMAAFVEDVMLTVHPHPTLGEAFMEAAANAVGAAVHIPNR